MNEAKIIVNSNTNIEELLAQIDGQSEKSIVIESDAGIENVKSIAKHISELTDQGFRFYNVSFKSLSTEDKIELLKFAMTNEVCVANLVETMVLLVNSSNNYNAEFFSSENVFFSSLVEYLDICDEIEDETNLLREKIVYYFLATLKSYVNHPRFVLMDSNNCETMPQMYECILMLLDIFNLSFIMNTPNLKVPTLDEISNNVKNNSGLIDIWANKQNFVKSTLGDLYNLIMENNNLQSTEEEQNG